LTRSQIEELISADQRKNQFIAMLSHELRSPLGSIQNAVGVLLGGTRADATAQQRMHELIERQVRHMALLVTDMLDVSRIACGQLRLQCGRVDACAVLRNAIETLEPDFRQRHQQLSIRWPQSAAPLSADADRLEQVFVNLLANASKYTDPGGEIALSVQVCDSHVVVRVRDSGIGIAHDALPHIFDLFMQVDASAPRSRSGLGIGLALVRTIVELHGGSVLADSAGPGQGSEFTVRLPMEA
jgi:signal transduction histidine kinase